MNVQKIINQLKRRGYEQDFDAIPNHRAVPFKGNGIRGIIEIDGKGINQPLIHADCSEFWDKQSESGALILPIPKTWKQLNFLISRDRLDAVHRREGRLLFGCDRVLLSVSCGGGGLDVSSNR